MAVFIWTAKIDRRKTALVLVGAVVLCGAVLAAVFLGTRGTAASAAVSPKGVKTAEDRAAYLTAWGWQVPDDAAEVEELELPKEFGPEYDQYMSLQADQGFDLTKYAGKRIKRYTYDILNYPTGEAGVQAHLLICKNTVVAGEIVGEDFLHGLAMPG
ncbi:DUF4830 domain-containing protein [Pseudoflavonifractor phocaeensis]|uniref:DUF4830 domain-containing protein n=1 Tax=Pseudoflavonifractor phocaeensis TaxID=1870988 RepID=UPI00313EF020